MFDELEVGNMTAVNWRDGMFTVSDGFERESTGYPSPDVVKLSLDQILQLAEWAKKVSMGKETASAS